MIDKMMAWENGELELREMVELFAELIENGKAWSLQGCYGRQAAALIEAGYISNNGEINEDALEEWGI